jgi:hypothetical protein
MTMRAAVPSETVRFFMGPPSGVGPEPEVT